MGRSKPSYSQNEIDGAVLPWLKFIYSFSKLQISVNCIVESSNSMEQTLKTKRSLILKAIICSVYLFLTIFYHHIDKYLSGTILLDSNSFNSNYFYRNTCFWNSGNYKNYSSQKKLDFKTLLTNNNLLNHNFVHAIQPLQTWFRKTRKRGWI